MVSSPEANSFVLVATFKRLYIMSANGSTPNTGLHSNTKMPVSIDSDCSASRYFYTLECPDINMLRSLSIANRWLETDLPIGDDIKDVTTLSESELDFYRFLFTFLSAADDLVNLNLGNLSELFTQKDILHYYIEQECIEVVHSRVYSAIQLLLFKCDAEARTAYVDSMITKPELARKVEWLRTRIGECESIAEKYILMILIEGIFFVASFAAIAYLRTHNIFIVTCQTNDLISRDEAIHTTASCCIYNNYLPAQIKPSTERIHSLFREAVELECEFISTCAPRCSNLLNVADICNYVRYSADRLLGIIKVAPIFNVPPPHPDFPLAFMVIEKHTNFFERHSTTYSGTVINDL